MSLLYTSSACLMHFSKRDGSFYLIDSFPKRCEHGTESGPRNPDPGRKELNIAICFPSCEYDAGPLFARLTPLSDSATATRPKKRRRQ